MRKIALILLTAIIAVSSVSASGDPEMRHARIGYINTKDNEIVNQITQEYSDRSAADSKLQEKMDDISQLIEPVKVNIDTLNEGVKKNIDIAVATYKDIYEDMFDAVEENKKVIADETSEREKSDLKLQNDIADVDSRLSDTADYAYKIYLKAYEDAVNAYNTLDSDIGANKKAVEELDKSLSKDIADVDSRLSDTADYAYKIYLKAYEDAVNAYNTLDAGISASIAANEKSVNELEKTLSKEIADVDSRLSSTVDYAYKTYRKAYEDAVNAYKTLGAGIATSIVASEGSVNELEKTLNKEIADVDSRLSDTADYAYKTYRKAYEDAVNAYNTLDAGISASIAANEKSVNELEETLSKDIADVDSRLSDTADYAYRIYRKAYEDAVNAYNTLDAGISASIAASKKSVEELEETLSKKISDVDSRLSDTADYAYKTYRKAYKNAVKAYNTLDAGINANKVSVENLKNELQKSIDNQNESFTEADRNLKSEINNLKDLNDKSDAALKSEINNLRNISNDSDSLLDKTVKEALVKVNKRINIVNIFIILIALLLTAAFCLLVVKALSFGKIYCQDNEKLNSQIADINKSQSEQSENFDGRVNKQTDDLSRHTDQIKTVKDQLNTYNEKIIHQTEMLHNQADQIKNQSEHSKAMNDAISSQANQINQIDGQINNQSDQIKKQLDMIQHQNDQIRNQATLIKDQTEIIEKQSEQINSQADQIKNQSEQINNQDDLIRQLIEQVNNHSTRIEQESDRLSNLLNALSLVRKDLQQNEK